MRYQPKITKFLYTLLYCLVVYSVHCTVSLYSIHCTQCKVYTIHLYHELCECTMLIIQRHCKKLCNHVTCNQGSFIIIIIITLKECIYKIKGRFTERHFTRDLCICIKYHSFGICTLYSPGSMVIGHIVTCNKTQ